MTELDTSPAPAWAAAREHLRNAVVSQRIALRPDRVMVLTEREQALILDTLETVALQLGAEDSVPWQALAALHAKVAVGDEYEHPTDELVRKTLEKRAAEAHVRRLNGRIGELDEMVVDELLARGDSAGKHADTGASYRVGRRVYAKLATDAEDAEERARVKAAAGRALIDAGLGDFVREDFNLNTLSAHFREQIKAHDEAQRALPEHERVPKAAEEFLPAPLRGLIELDDTPHITVRAS